MVPPSALWLRPTRTLPPCRSHLSAPSSSLTTTCPSRAGSAHTIASWLAASRPTRLETAGSSSCARLLRNSGASATGSIETASWPTPIRASSSASSISRSSCQPETWIWSTRSFCTGVSGWARSSSRICAYPRIAFRHARSACPVCEIRSAPTPLGRPCGSSADRTAEPAVIGPTRTARSAPPGCHTRSVPEAARPRPTAAPASPVRAGRTCRRAG